MRCRVMKYIQVKDLEALLQNTTTENGWVCADKIISGLKKMEGVTLQRVNGDIDTIVRLLDNIDHQDQIVSAVQLSDAQVASRPTISKWVRSMEQIGYKPKSEWGLFRKEIRRFLKRIQADKEF